MELGEARKKLEEIKKRLEELRVFFEIDKKKLLLEEINKKLTESDIWTKPKELGELSKTKKDIEETIALFDESKKSADDIGILIELGEEGEDVQKDMDESINKLNNRLDEIEIMTLFSEEDDKRDTILTIHPGAGGTESQDWTQMLMRMYLRYCDKKGFKTEIVDLQPGEEAGIKSVTIRIKGRYSFGHLIAESGVHRLVRISPFDANKRRHTSFSAVFVYPEVEDDIEIEIKPEDLRIETFRSSGKGGQHVNVTDSAVRITHIPTGIVVSCQNERSQHKNKEIAMKILRSRLYELEKRKRMQKIQEIEESKGEIAWGNQIRSYVLQPYQKITDHRTKMEIGDVQRVLDGDLDPLIRAWLIQRKKEKQKQ